MATRADFYVGKGPKARWIGSYAMDGDPHSFSKHFINAKNAKEFRKAFLNEIKHRDDGTLPKDGWPWPWTDSNGTDYSYFFHQGNILVYYFGEGGIPLKYWLKIDWDDAKKAELGFEKNSVFPDMTSIQKVIFGPRSGLLFVAGI